VGHILDFANLASADLGIQYVGSATFVRKSLIGPGFVAERIENRLDRIMLVLPNEFIRISHTGGPILSSRNISGHIYSNLVLGSTKSNFSGAIALTLVLDNCI